MASSITRFTRTSGRVLAEVRRPQPVATKKPATKKPAAKAEPPPPVEPAEVEAEPTDG